METRSLSSHFMELSSAFHPTYEPLFSDSQQMFSQFSEENITPINQSPADNLTSYPFQQDTLQSPLFTSSFCNFPAGNDVLLSDDHPIPTNPEDAKKRFTYSYSGEEEKQSSGSKLIYVPRASVSCESIPTSKHDKKNNKRVKWNKEMHDKFMMCVNLLGGAEKATPKAILTLMGTKEMKISHIKSHLQKYRSPKYMPESLQEKSKETIHIRDVPHRIIMKSWIQIKKALLLQQDLEKHLQEQLEIQQNLQLLIEEQGKQVKNMLEKQRKAKQRQFPET